jgi:putative membrane protein
MLPLLHVATTPYSFHWNLHPDVILLCIVVLVAYFYAVTQLRETLSDGGQVKRSQMALFCGGVFAIYAVSGTPIHELSEQYLLSFHMFQHSVYVLIAAPLLLAGIPGWIFQAAFRIRGVLPVARVITHPIVGILGFNMLLLVTHLPAVVDYALYHHWFHFCVHAALVSSAMCMWWPVLSTVPELPRLPAPLQMGYLFMQSLLPAVLASFITFADGAVYSFYEKAPRTWGMSAETDQQLGGGLMKVMGSVIVWTWITVVFFQWYKHDEAATSDPGRDLPSGELESMGLLPRP